MGEIMGGIAENWQTYSGFFISWILPFLIVFVAILLGYRLKSKTPWKIGTQLVQEVRKVSDDEKQQPDIHVESHDQRGGITAYQVNIQPGDRQLTEANAKGLEDALKKFSFKSVDVTAVMGDGEAFRLASQIKNFLVSKGFDVNGVNQAVYSAPVQGQNIEAPNDKGVINIIIGNR